jgi:hypothetical protein
MALVVKDRVKESTTSTGTGAITLAGAQTGYQGFTAIGDGNTTYYVISGGSEWEVGLGTYTASGTTLSRDTVLSSSNSGSLVNFSAGTKDVYVVYPAGKAVYSNAGNTVTFMTPISEYPQSVSASYTITASNNASSIGPLTIGSSITVTVPSTSNWVIY